MVIVYHKLKILHHRRWQKCRPGKARLHVALGQFATRQQTGISFMVWLGPVIHALLPRCAGKPSVTRPTPVANEARHSLRLTWIGLVAALAVLLTGCDPVQIIEGSDTHVSIRYDGLMNGLDKATELAQRACGQHGKTAKLRKTYYEGLGAGERFAFFDCV